MKSFKGFSIPVVLILAACIIVSSCQIAMAARTSRQSVRIILRVVQPVTLNIDTPAHRSVDFALTDKDLQGDNVTKTEYFDQNGRVILYTKVSDI